MKFPNSSQRLESELAELETIFDFSLDMIGSGNLSGYFTRINKRFREILGYEDEEFMEVPFLYFVHPEDLEKTQKALSAAANGQEKIFIENRYKCKEGSYKWIDWRVFANVQENRFVAVGRDISKNKELEKRLKENHALLKSIKDTAIDSIFCKDIKRRYIFVNKAMANLLGCDEVDLLGKTPEEVFGSEEGTKIREVDDKTFSGQKVSEIRQLNIKGEQFFFHTVQVPHQIDNGKVLSISGIVRDVTEQVQVTKELKKHRNQLENLVSKRTRELKKKSINLEEANIALRVLLQQRNEDKKKFEEKVIHRIEKLIVPYLNILKTKMLNSEQQAYLELLEANLQEITAPFNKNISWQLSQLTPAEVHIVDLIKMGKSTKEIASLLKLSPTTISTHRQNIRKKLNLTNQKMNLRTALLSTQ